MVVNGELIAVHNKMEYININLYKETIINYRSCLQLYMLTRFTEDN